MARKPSVARKKMPALKARICSRTKPLPSFFVVVANVQRQHSHLDRPYTLSPSFIRQVRRKITSRLPYPDYGLAMCWPASLYGFELLEVETCRRNDPGTVMNTQRTLFYGAAGAKENFRGMQNAILLINAKDIVLFKRFADRMRLSVHYTIYKGVLTI